MFSKMKTAERELARSIRRHEGAPIKEPEFYAALMKIWLGNSPADPLLKDALLGRAPIVNANRYD